MQDEDTHYYPASGTPWTVWLGALLAALTVGGFMAPTTTGLIAYFGLLGLLPAYLVLRSGPARKLREWWTVHHPRGLDGLLVGPDGITELLPGQRQVEHSWATVVSVTVDDSTARVRLTDGEIHLERRFDEASRLMIAQDIRKRLRERGAPDGGAAVDGARISRWLGVPAGKWLVCRCPTDPECSLAAWQDGLVVRRPGQRTHLGWSDLRDLELVPAERAEPQGWRLFTARGEFLFRADWSASERLADALECALAEQAVGHLLPDLVAGDVSDAAISLCESVEPSPERGISRV